ncbi:prolyl oligopeptidase family serine peptidase [Aliiglaciecola sp. 2_MG-2023]|uniref:alpha/beta hydrolase family protein n=1 Tax=unclassified Aliiglaciecola TaxID=2593648 RepID=UPI0026E46F3E|nr:MULTISPECIES: alpha/beta fold hydrolase [unclassified Aliiglaciecola]MDO6712456.1 prolyl oligopeptidase family serine peptidase [Aliiglaciecola sp. 2_MG-2023]MDO6753486.1 prolyl oligopeptidase family serine peptidase [Aliiglaciecola sp. 1_MG-2023]
MKRLVILFVIWSCALSVFAKTPLSLEDLNQIRKVKTVTFSPDGRLTAVTLNLPDDSYDGIDLVSLRELYVVSKRGKISPVISGGRPMGHVRWSPQSDALYFLAKMQDDQTVSLYHIEIGDTDPIKIYSADTDIKGFDVNEQNDAVIIWGYSTPDHQQQLLNDVGFNATVFDESARNASLWRLSLENPSKKARLLYNDSHVLSAKWIPRSEQILLHHSPSSLTDDVVMESSISVLKPNGQMLITNSHRGKVGEMSVSPDGSHYAFIGGEDQSDPAEGRLYLSQVVSETPIDILPDFDGHVSAVNWFNSSTVGFIGAQNLTTFIGNKDIEDLAGSYRVRVKHDGKISALSVDSKGYNIAYIADSPEHPAELFLKTKHSNKRMTNSNVWLKDRILPKQIEVSYTARDGTIIDGILVEPIDDSAPTSSAIIFVHGGPEDHFSLGWNNRYSYPVAYAASKGFYSFLPNYRGSTGKGVAFSKLGQKDYAGAEFNDLLDARTFLIENYGVDPQRVGITGTSYGGYAAAWAATKQHNYFAASVAGMGVSNQISKFGTTDIPSEMLKQHALIAPWQDWTWYLERSPIYHTQNATTPLLLLHGSRDTRVSANQSKELYRYFKSNADAPVRLILYPNEAHGLALAPAKLDYSMRLMRWMDHFVIQQNKSKPNQQLPHPDLPEPELQSE